jgi:polyisoprenoid-binding protein YceI
MVEAELFGLDRAHSFLEFRIGFMGMSTVKGTFGRYDLALMHNEDDMEKVSVTVVIDVSTIDTGSNFRDTDLQSERFFDAENHPYIVFQSDRITEEDDGFVAHGRLKMRGVTREVSMPFRRTLGRTADAGWGNIRVGYAGTLTLNRTDFGIHGGDFWGIQALSEGVDIEFMILGTIYNYAIIAFSDQEKPSVGAAMLEAFEAGGLEAARARFGVIRHDSSDAYVVEPREINVAGSRLYERGLYEEALAFFKLAADLDADDISTHLNLGKAHAMTGDRERAVAHYRLALEQDPLESWALEMLRRLGSPVDLDEQIEKARAKR